jgi:RimJ/RimL family protein N-acetyltransferase
MILAPQAFDDREGRPLLIRPASEDDAPALLAYVDQVDGESTNLSREPGEFNVTIPQERMFLRNTALQSNALYLLALDGESIVGSLDFHGGIRKRGRHSGEFGMSVRRDYWGSGVGGHLLDALLEWANANHEIHKIKLRVQAGNERAIALYRSRGFVAEGILQKDMRIAGAWVDLLLMARWFD